jgi:uncharacterized OB-fold protein
MTARSTASEETAFYEQTWDLSYRHALGDTAGRFLRGLKAREFMGRKCPKCERVILPARSFCDRCHVETTDWSTAEPRGELMMFTIVYEQFKGLPEPPYAIGYVLLEGADTAILGYLRGVPLEDARVAADALRVGTAMEARFVDEPRGSVLDYWFEPSSRR